VRQNFAYLLKTPNHIFLDNKTPWRPVPLQMLSLVLKLTKTNPPAGALQRQPSRGQHMNPRRKSLVKKNIVSKVKCTYTGWWFSCAAQHIPYS